METEANLREIGALQYKMMAGSKYSILIVL